MAIANGARDCLSTLGGADALVAGTEGGAGGPSTLTLIDADYVDRIGVTDRIAEWRQLAERELASAPTPA